MRNHEGIGFLLYDVSRFFRRDFAARAARIGLTQAQWRALLHLSRMEGCRQTALADTLEVRPITAGRLVDRLQRAGLVRRTRDPRDRRAFALFLTPRSRAQLKKLFTVADQTCERMFEGVPVAERKGLSDVLVRMRANLQRPGRGRREPAAPRLARAARGALAVRADRRRAVR